jgi:hypothetical protein
MVSVYEHFGSRTAPRNGLSSWTEVPLYRLHSRNTILPPYPVIRSLPQPEQKMGNYRNKRFISFKTHAKWEQAIAWWNPAAQMYPVLDSSSFVPVPMLKCHDPLLSYTWEKVHRACTMYCTGHAISSLMLVMSVPNLSNKLYRIYVCYTDITLCIAFDVLHGFT